MHIAFEENVKLDDLEYQIETTARNNTRRQFTTAVRELLRDDD